MTETKLAAHFGQMLGLAQGGEDIANMANDEIAVDRQISEALSIIRAAINDADYINSALHTLGMPAAKNMDHAISAIAAAVDMIRKAQSDMVMLRYSAGQQSTTNMMAAVFAAIGKEDTP